MKILTILIFSGDRMSIKELLDDIVELNKYNIDVRVVEWSNDKKNLIKKNYIYKIYKKKIKNLKIYYQGGNWQQKYKIFINKFKSKYILLIGDDDRINIFNFKKIFKYLKSNYSGVTLSYKNFQNNFEIEKNDDFGLDYIRPFNLKRDLKKIGFTSCQIIKADLISKIFNEEKKYLTKSMFPQNFIILSIIKKFNNWKVLELKCIYNRSGSLDIFKINSRNLSSILKISNRLKSEYSGYLSPLKKNFIELSDYELKRIYNNIFFSNIISWIFLSIKIKGKRKTYNNIKSVRGIIKEPFLVKITLMVIYICPILILDFLRIFRKFLKKVF